VVLNRVGTVQPIHLAGTALGVQECRDRLRAEEAAGRRVALARPSTSGRSQSQLAIGWGWRCSTGSGGAGW
jgi:hypothetical protein